MESRTGGAISTTCVVHERDRNIATIVFEEFLVAAEELLGGVCREQLVMWGEAWIVRRE